MIEAVVFDMDGLLVDSEPLWDRARLEAFGADRLQWTDQDQRNVMGMGAQAWGAYLAERLNHAFTIEHIVERVVLQMEQFYRAAVPQMPGADAALRQLHGRYPLGLASGSSYRLIHAVLEGASWAGLFQEVLSTDDVPQGKPAPDVYSEITRRLNVPPAHTAIFEDSGNGILSGHGAGVKVIAVPDAVHRPVPEILGKAHRVLDSLTDFTPDLLADL
jgi:HAD superfamily hydrolase (TIGR01509 family)